MKLLNQLVITIKDLHVARGREIVKQVVEKIDQCIPVHLLD